MSNLEKLNDHNWNLFDTTTGGKDDKDNDVGEVTMDLSQLPTPIKNLIPGAQGINVREQADFSAP